jgi:hypothetical protein
MESEYITEIAYLSGQRHLKLMCDKRIRVRASEMAGSNFTVDGLTCRQLDE